MKRILATTILLFICFLEVVYFILPQYSDFKLLRSKISQKESLIQERNIYFSNLEEASNKLEKYAESLEKINSALPLRMSPASLLSFLQEKASESGLAVGSMGIIKAQEVGAEEETAGIKESYFSLSVVGTLSSLENFLKVIENSSRMIEVENISLTTTEEGSLAITLRLKVHSY